MDFDQVLKKRHSVRAYTDREIPRDVLARIVDAVSYAPSSFNEQPWRLYVAEGDARLKVGEIMARSTVYLEDYMEVLGSEHFDEVSHWYTELGGCPVVVGVTVPSSEDELTELNRTLAAGAALEHVLLAATNEGVASCAITFSFWLRDDLARALGVEEDRVLIALVALGYPAEEPAAPPHSHDVVVYRD